MRVKMLTKKLWCINYASSYNYGQSAWQKINQHKMAVNHDDDTRLMVSFPGQAM